MNAFYYTYIACWVTACITAIVMMVKNRRTIVLFGDNYREFLLVKWKVATFLIAISAFVILAPYTGDPTWDYYDAAFMSILTFITAPWAVGTIYKFIRREEQLKIFYIAVCTWMFSASWSYDIYLVYREGYYPNTWWTNIFASSVLYLSAGLFWNLEYKEGRGVIFGFMESNWPEIDTKGGFNKILLYALPFMILAAAVFVPFFT